MKTKIKFPNPLKKKNLKKQLKKTNNQLQPTRKPKKSQTL